VGPSHRCRSCKPLPEEVRLAADLLGRRSMIAVLAASLSGALRFNEFRQVIGEIPPRTLVARLTELEAAGILHRVVVDARPPRVEYRLTNRGRRLGAVIDALAVWAGPERLRSSR
jgi:DNA-binding HxlR family transcriptional regulator